MNIKSTSGKIVSLMLGCVMALGACKQVALFEKLEHISGARWSSTQVPVFEFAVTDTATAYQIYVVLRHTNRYPYRNLWLNLGIQQPGDSAMRQQQFELMLAGPDRWLGVGMDDIYERRVSLFATPVKFRAPGMVRFSLRHTMRLDPLPEVMQAGIRVEPVK